MQTRESVLAARLFSGLHSEEQPEKGSAELSLGLLDMMRGAEGDWTPLSRKHGDAETRDLMCRALMDSEESEVASIGQGIHRPFKVTFKDGIESGIMTTLKAVLKTVHFQFENRRYCESVDTKITGPEREMLSYELDQLIGFDLTPPTIGREIAVIGYGSLQAWADQPTAWQWIDRGYDYRKDKKNPWLHRLAAFDFIRGEIDRHSNNWIMDAERRVYAIDNGYSFVKGDNRKWFRTSAGKHLKGTSIHPAVLGEIQSIDEAAVKDLLWGRNFQNDEEAGVLSRIRQLKGLRVWEKLGELW
jgi:hypothetical protein